jgi:hypothetical protein
MRLIVFLIFSCSILVPLSNLQAGRKYHSSPKKCAIIFDEKALKEFFKHNKIAYDDLVVEITLVKNPDSFSRDDFGLELDELQKLLNPRSPYPSKYASQVLISFKKDPILLHAPKGLIAAFNRKRTQEQNFVHRT